MSGKKEVMLASVATGGQDISTNGDSISTHLNQRLKT
jgi:hypothetical protein